MSLSPEYISTKSTGRFLVYEEAVLIVSVIRCSGNTLAMPVNMVSCQQQVIVHAP
jgi:hypothetical protein